MNHASTHTPRDLTVDIQVMLGTVRYKGGRNRESEPAGRSQAAAEGDVQASAFGPINAVREASS
jgi:hypothetical protein